MNDNYEYEHNSRKSTQIFTLKRYYIRILMGKIKKDLSKSQVEFKIGA